MTLSEFTNRLQDLCHSGHGADTVKFNGINPDTGTVLLISPEGAVTEVKL